MASGRRDQGKERTKYYTDTCKVTHTEDQCDKCSDKVGIQNLRAMPFIFLDKNDKFHEDLGHGYRQYHVCDKCYGHC